MTRREGDTARPASPPLPDTADILVALREELAVVLNSTTATVNITSVSAGTPLLSLPLDSLSLMEVMSRIEDRYRIMIPEDRAFAFGTAGDIADFIRQALAAKAARTARRVQGDSA